MTKKDTYHVGIIGAGMISGAYLDNMTTMFGIISVDAIANRNVARAEQVAEKYGIRACSIDELLADESIDIVVNLTTPNVHEEMVTRILNAGKHAYTEKCFALDTEGAARMCRLAEEKGLYLGCAPDSFMCGWAQTAKRVIESGRLGTITSFAIAGNRDNDRLLSAMDYANKPGGGIILDYSVYYLTMLVHLLGPVKRISCNIKAPYPTHVNTYELSPHYGETFDSPNESQFYSHMELENGISGTFAINSDSAFFDQTYFAIYGSKGILYLGNPDWYNGDVYLYENTADFSKAFTPERIHIDNPFGYNTNSRGVGVADMAYAIRDGREMRASAERCYHVLDVPVVLVNLQKKKAPDFANTDNATWLGELYACGAVGEMVADLERAGKRHAVITGVQEGGDPEAWAEIEDWCRAAQVRRRFRDTNLAQIGRPYPGMMDLYIDETNLYHRMWLYTKQFDWEKMWAIADDIDDEAAVREKAQDILDTFDIEGGGTIEKVWDMAKYVVAFERWVKEEKLGFIASHYDGFAQGVAGKLDSMLIPAFSMLIRQGTACAVEGDIKVAMAMSILKTISGMGQLSEMYSIDFDEDICIIGHSGSGDYDISRAKKPTMKIVEVFHGKTGGGYLTQFYPEAGPVTYLGITQDRDGYFKFVVAEGVNEEGPIFTFGDTNMRTRFTCGAREFCNKWSEAGPTHHMAAATGRHIDTILKVAKIFNVPVDIVTR